MRPETIRDLKNRKNISLDNKGVGGFFTDIPALIVIIIGLSIFTVSAYNFHNEYVQKKYNDGIEENLDSFMDNIRNYDYIAESDGVFYASNVQRLNSTTIKKDFNPNSLGFNYKIEIIDTSGYEQRYDKSIETETVPSNKDVYIDSSSITIRSSSTYHLGKLKISIWECG